MQNPFQKELESLQNELMPNPMQLQSQLISTFEGIERGCISDSKDNADSFVKCMMKQTKKIEREQKRFQYKLQFLQFSVTNCFGEASVNNQSFDKCKAEAKDRMDKYLKEFFDLSKK